MIGALSTAYAITPNLKFDISISRHRVDNLVSDYASTSGHWECVIQPTDYEESRDNRVDFKKTYRHRLRPRTRSQMYASV